MIIASGMVIASGLVIAFIQNLCQLHFLLLAIILVSICELVAIFYFTFEREYTIIYLTNQETNKQTNRKT